MQIKQTAHKTIFIASIQIVCNGQILLGLHPFQNAAHLILNTFLVLLLIDLGLDLGSDDFLLGVIIFQPVIFFRQVINLELKCPDLLADVRQGTVIDIFQPLNDGLFIIQELLLNQFLPSVHRSPHLPV